MMLCQAVLSDGFLLFLDILGREDIGGEAVGGSNKSDRSEAEPGEKGESGSMSIGDPPEL